MSTESESLRRCHLVLDGATYQITVQKTDDRFSASWRCLKCGDLSRSTHHDDTLEEAARRAVLMAPNTTIKFTAI